MSTETERRMNPCFVRTNSVVSQCPNPARVHCKHLVGTEVSKIQREFKNTKKKVCRLTVFNATLIYADTSATWPMCRCVSPAPSSVSLLLQNLAEITRQFASLCCVKSR